MVILKEITENSWLVLSDEEQERIGLLSSTPKGIYSLLSKDGRIEFQDRKEVLDFFEENVFDRVQVPECGQEQEFFIKGYPIDYKNPIEADIDSELPLFKKTKTSRVHHCAGYYCLKFPKGWIHSFCPKLSTIEKYEYAGPFMTKTEMKAHLSALKRNDK